MSAPVSAPSAPCQQPYWKDDHTMTGPIFRLDPESLRANPEEAEETGRAFAEK